MSWFDNVKLSRKLGLAFGACFLLVACVGTVAINQIASLSRASNSVAAQAIGGQSRVGDILSGPRRIRTIEFQVLLSTSAPERAKYEAEIAKETDKTKAALDAYEKTITTQDNRDLFNRTAAVWSDYLRQEATLFTLVNSGKPADAKAYINGPMHDQILGFSSSLGDLRKWNDNHAKELAARAGSAAQQGTRLLVSLLVVSLFVTAILCTVASRAICAPMRVVVDKMNSFHEGLSGLADNTDALGKGDFNARHIHRTPFMEWQRRDELGELSRAFDAMLAEGKRAVLGVTNAQQSLSVLVAEARHAATAITAAAQDVASGNADLSERTAEQASSLEETAASMEEMTGVVKQSAENAQLANRLAQEAREVAEAGGRVVGDAVDSMSKISASSKQISDIIGVIDEIAFQTNLLALNAAVEAARVGEQGRGFAVVASEVRNLAGRSSTSAKEIKALVLNSVVEVEAGTERVNKSGHQLQEIVTAVKKVSTIVSEITSGAQEQAAGIEQVNKAVIQMDGITQRNAALVGEATTASQSMAQLAISLQATMSRFKVDEAAAASANSLLNTGAKPVIDDIASTGTYGGSHSGQAAVMNAPKLELIYHSPSMEEF